ncbi:hypothetical protein BJ170DRAFT_594993 [Xylariales sp. AK1849]|nr:hypothetical protein BJ170DRAFT_594993 [Xylariales sp. AK1849]
MTASSPKWQITLQNRAAARKLEVEVFGADKLCISIPPLFNSDNEIDKQYEAGILRDSTGYWSKWHQRSASPMRAAHSLRLVLPPTITSQQRSTTVGGSKTWTITSTPLRSNHPDINFKQSNLTDIESRQITLSSILQAEWQIPTAITLHSLSRPSLAPSSMVKHNGLKLDSSATAHVDAGADIEAHGEAVKDRIDDAVAKGPKRADASSGGRVIVGETGDLHDLAREHDKLK